MGQHSSSISPSGTHFTALFVHHAPGGRPAEKLIMPEKKKRRSDRRREGEERGEKGRRSEATLTVQTKLNVPLRANHSIISNDNVYVFITKVSFGLFLYFKRC